ncbi:MAG: four helix bundle protein, partial [Deltaproteobacteria bacterium]|nr:four helix bundle protein [Deltaproteobacteria bacterium]
MKKQIYDLEERLLEYSVRIIKIVIHKLRISLKELRETQQWLKLIQRVPLIKKPELLDD